MLQMKFAECSNLYFMTFKFLVRFTLFKIKKSF